MARCVALMLAALAAAAPAQQFPGPQQYLDDSIRATERTFGVLDVLMTTQDKDLAPIFTSLSRSGDKTRRLYAVQRLRHIAGDAAAPALLERLKTDESMTIRTVALVALLDLDAVSDEQLVEALALPEVSIRTIAARALVKRGRGETALATLEELLSVPDPATRVSVQMSLLNAGHDRHLPALLAMAIDPAAPADVLGVMIRQIEQDKIAAAAPIANELTRRGTFDSRLSAFKALSAASKSMPEALLKSVSEGRLIERVNLLVVLSERDDAGEHLRKLAAGDDPVAQLAAFELVRAQGGEVAAAAARQAIQSGHQIVIDYVLDRAGDDIDKQRDRAGWYVEPLLAVINNVDPSTGSMGPQHLRAAAAATLLADLGTPEAMAALGKLLQGRYNAILRSVSAGMLRTKNAAVCELVGAFARSQYGELVQNAMLVLGRFGDAAARPLLDKVLANAENESLAIVTLASWYSLKVDGKAAEAAGQIATGLE